MCQQATKATAEGLQEQAPVAAGGTDTVVAIKASASQGRKKQLNADIMDGSWQPQKKKATAKQEAKKQHASALSNITNFVQGTDTTTGGGDES